MIENFFVDVSYFFMIVSGFCLLAKIFYHQKFLYPTDSDEIVFLSLFRRYFHPKYLFFLGEKKSNELARKANLLLKMFYWMFSIGIVFRIIAEIIKK